MPGIAGFLTTRPQAQAMPELERMEASLTREPFYERGRLIDTSAGLYLCWTAQPGSISARAPLESQDGSRTLVFSGNEFSGPRTIEALLEGASSGQELAARLNGVFHGLLIDRKRREILLFNDRFGLRRIYVHRAAESLYFAAEAKAILAARPACRQLHTDGLSQFLACGYTLGAQSLFEEIEILPAASAWSFRDGRLQEEGRFFSAEAWERQSPLAPEPFYQALRERFAQILPRYFAGELPVGFSLTGGLDTRAILAWRRPEPGSLPCYTFAGPLRESRDVRIARKVARLCRQSFQPLPVDDAFLANFAHYAARTVHLSDGCCPVNFAPDLYLNALARQIAPVRLTGTYGDQVLRRQCTLKYMPPDPLAFNAALYAHVQAVAPQVEALRGGDPMTTAALTQMPCAFHNMRCLEDSQLEIRSPFLDNDLLELLYQAPPSVVNDNVMRTRLIAEGWPELRAIRTDLGFLGGGGKLGEALSSRFHRFTMRCEWALDIGMPQRLAPILHFFEPLQAERLILGVHKFSHFRLWYKRALASYVREILLDERTLARPYIHADGLRTAVATHLSGQRNETSALHKLLTLELTQRYLLEGDALPSLPPHEQPDAARFRH